MSASVGACVGAAGTYPSGGQAGLAPAGSAAVSSAGTYPSGGQAVPCLANHYCTGSDLDPQVFLTPI